MNILKDVSCSYTDSAGKKHLTGIRVVMWDFNRDAVANQLASMRRAGRWVDIVYNPDGCTRTGWRC